MNPHGIGERPQRSAEYAHLCATLLRETELTMCLHKKALPQRDAALLILAVGVGSPKDVREVKRLGRNSGLPEIVRWNISDILGKPRGLAIRLPQGWCLTSEGQRHVKGLDVIPEKKARGWLLPPETCAPLPPRLLTRV
jgi:hypothetical protein